MPRRGALRPLPQSLSLPSASGLGTGGCPGTEGTAWGRDEPPKQPYPSGHIDVHLPRTLEGLPCRGWGAGHPGGSSRAPFTTAVPHNAPRCLLTLLLGEDLFLPPETGNPLNDGVSEGHLVGRGG